MASLRIARHVGKAPAAGDAIRPAGPAVSGGRPIGLLAYADSAYFSGAEAVFCEVLGGLGKDGGFEVTCAIAAGNERLAAAVAAAGIRDVVEVPAQPGTLAAIHLHDPLRRRRIRGGLAGRRFDVQFVNLASMEYGATPLLMDDLAPRTVAMLHVPGGFREFGFRLGRLRERLSAGAPRRIDRACVFTPSAKATAARTWNLPADAIEVLPPPRPRLREISRDVARRELGLGGAACVGVAGRLTLKQKGQDTFVEAAAALAGRFPDLRFVIAGEGPDRARIEEMIESRGLAGRFDLLGNVEIDRFLAAVDLIAMPSRFEGLGLVAVEALAAGVPGVVTDVDGLRDVWPDALRVPPDDPAALAAALEGLLRRSERERLAQIEEARELMRGATTEDLATEVARVVRRVADAA